MLTSGLETGLLRETMGRPGKEEQVKQSRCVFMGYFMTSGERHIQAHRVGIEFAGHRFALFQAHMRMFVPITSIGMVFAHLTGSGKTNKKKERLNKLLALPAARSWPKRKTRPELAGLCSPPAQKWSCRVGSRRWRCKRVHQSAIHSSLDRIPEEGRAIERFRGWKGTLTYIPLQPLTALRKVEQTCAG